MKDIDFEAQLKKDFIAEAAEMLEAVEAAFMEIERNPADKTAIDKIFRLAHTIKGSALSCGFVDLGNFAHIVETLLMHIREDRLITTSTVIDVLLQANDRLVEFVNVLRGGSDECVFTADIAKRIQDLLDSAATPVPKVIVGIMPVEIENCGFHLFEDDPPAALPTTRSVVLSPSFDEPAVKLLTEATAAGLDAYLELVRLTLSLGSGEQAIRLAPVLRAHEKSLENLVLLRRLRRAV